MEIFALLNLYIKRKLKKKNLSALAELYFVVNTTLAVRLVYFVTLDGLCDNQTKNIVQKKGGCFSINMKNM